MNWKLLSPHHVYLTDPNRPKSCQRPLEAASATRGGTAQFLIHWCSVYSYYDLPVQLVSTSPVYSWLLLRAFTCPTWEVSVNADRMDLNNDNRNHRFNAFVFDVGAYISYNCICRFRLMRRLRINGKLYIIHSLVISLGWSQRRLVIAVISLE